MRKKFVRCIFIVGIILLVLVNIKSYSIDKDSNNVNAELKSVFDKNPLTVSIKQESKEEKSMEYDSSKIFPWIKVMEGYEGDTPFASVPPFTVTINGKEQTLDNAALYFLGDLAIFFVYDLEDSQSVSMVNRGDLPKGIDDNKLFQIAVDNLVEKITFKLQRTNYGGYGVIAGGNYEAAALLCNNLLEAIGDQLGKDFVIALPARDMLLVADADDENMINNMQDVAVNVYQNGNATLTKKMFYYSISKKVLSLYPKDIDNKR